MGSLFGKTPKPQEIQPPPPPMVPAPSTLADPTKRPRGIAAPSTVATSWTGLTAAGASAVGKTLLGQ